MRDAGEPGLAGWVIHLDGTDGQGQAVHVTDVTDANGDYSFTVNPGSYTVSEEQQAGWTQTFPASGDYDIVLTSGETETGNDFGNFQQATKSGTKFNDLDGDGVRDAGEPGLVGWVIHLDGTDGLGQAVNLTDVTDANGDYSFTVNPGTYTVSEEQQAGWTQSFPASGDYDIVLTSGETETASTSATSSRRSSPAPSSTTWTATACAMRASRGWRAGRSTSTDRRPGPGGPCDRRDRRERRLLVRRSTRAPTRCRRSSRRAGPRRSRPAATTTSC